MTTDQRKFAAKELMQPLLSLSCRWVNLRSTNCYFFVSPLDIIHSVLCVAQSSAPTPFLSIAAKHGVFYHK
jgi:hypothetical protein